MLYLSQNAMPMALCARPSCLFLSYCIHQIVWKSSLKQVVYSCLFVPK